MAARDGEGDWVVGVSLGWPPVRLAVSWSSRAAGLVRRHWIFAVLLVPAVVLRVLLMIAYRPAIFYIDSVASYLLPLPSLDPTGQDPIGYDLYLLDPVLKVGNLATVVALQHLMGLGIAVAGYALLVHKGARRWLAALATVPVLLDAYQLQIETTIMTEPLFEAMIVAALVTLAWRARPGVPAVVVAGLLLGLATTVRQAGEPLIVPLVGYVLLAGGAWRRRLTAGALALGCFAGPVAAYETFYHSHTGKFAISHVGANALYGRVAPFAECAGAGIPQDEQVLCPTTPRGTRQGPDYWAHSPDSPYFVLQKRVGPVEVDRLTQDFCSRIIRHQPVDLVAAVGHDAAKVFQWNRLAQPPSDPPVDRWQFQKTMPLFLPLVSPDEISRLSHLYGDGDPATVPSLTTFMRAYQLRGGYTPGPVVALALLLALLPLARWRRAGRAGLPALLFLAAGVLVVLAGDLMVFSWRYQLPGYVLLPVAGVLGLTAVLDRRPALAPAAPVAAPPDSAPPDSAPPDAAPTDVTGRVEAPVSREPGA